MKNYFFIFVTLFSSTAFAKSLCTDLEVGEVRKVDIKRGSSKTNIEQKYTLRRVSDSHYESYLNLDFKLKKGLDLSMIQTPDFRKYVTSCFEKYNPRLVDEKGRSIALKLFDENEDHDIPAPRRVSIKLMPEDHRANSHAYNFDIDCETVIHESLHLMGLGDEYQEVDHKLNPNLFLRMFKRFVSNANRGAAFDCRAIGPVNSVMHNQWFLNSDVQVLFSAQVDAILYPNCQEMNEDYYSCVKKAYRTSSNNGAIFGCGNMKDECRTFNWVLSKDSPLRNSPRANAGMKSVDRKELKDQFLLNQ